MPLGTGDWWVSISYFNSDLRQNRCHQNGNNDRSQCNSCKLKCYRASAQDSSSTGNSEWLFSGEAIYPQDNCQPSEYGGYKPDYFISIHALAADIDRLFAFQSSNCCFFYRYRFLSHGLFESSLR